MSLTRPAYSFTAASFHWMVAVPLIGCVGSVLKCQQSPKEEKGKWMWRHKSLGLLTGCIVAPRLVYRLMDRSAYNVEKLAGAQWEHVASSVTHYGLYGFMVIMPASGIAMGYYGGKGLPFFFTTIPGITKTPENKASTGKIAGQSFKIHKTLGTYGKYLIPMHVGGAFTHYFKGQRIFSRVNPFSPRPKM
mmetsp:Transcript_26261/g.39762  ORF Transcript_26261/g.39762 Transcript_26261/m.39762 type:complete len:190 (-) Transcript_26261:102-671(-)|eukprot:CAMPEP_0194259266 /NCGR_PEP_ID=MMETSP0158-20130606/43208_1 /TAXON_ID=33649 /ORGANISM="Thalassionema nitzschioides, Strain L26-B" /LENGTH=189 /DNA_ID=CAMNT_0038999003 /DNA_START=44 /DNA_END=613 /DNA_ORIENTATION=-